MIGDRHKDLEVLAEDLAPKYQTAHPFPNISIDDFFDPSYLEEVLAEFPSVDSLKDKVHYSNPNEEKHATKGEGSFGPKTKALVHYLNSEPFLRFLQKISGIKEALIPDPYFEGGGFHEIKPQGYLKIHVDFHKHRSMNLDRRLNVLIYLNKDWKEEYGGNFELWEKDMSTCAVKVAPLFNRMAMFSTAGASWHGHPNPLSCPPDRSRKSLALYYYTAGRPEGDLTSKDSGRITTTFKAREGLDSSEMKRYNGLVNFANKMLPQSVIRIIKKIKGN